MMIASYLLPRNTDREFDDTVGCHMNVAEVRSEGNLQVPEVMHHRIKENLWLQAHDVSQN